MQHTQVAAIIKTSSKN